MRALLLSHAWPYSRCPPLPLITYQAITEALQPHLSTMSGGQLIDVLWSLARLSRPPMQVCPGN